MKYGGSPAPASRSRHIKRRPATDCSAAGRYLCAIQEALVARFGARARGATLAATAATARRTVTAALVALGGLSLTLVPAVLGQAEHLRRQADVAFRLVLLMLLRLMLRLVLRLLVLLRLMPLVRLLLVTRFSLIARLALALVARTLIVVWALIVIRPLIVVLALVLVALPFALIGPILVGTALAVVVVLLIARLLVLLLRLEARIQHPVIMVCMLEVILSRNPVAHLARVPRHGEELLHKLLGIAPGPHAAVEVGPTIAAPAAATGRTGFSAVAAALAIFHMVVIHWTVVASQAVP